MGLGWVERLGGAREADSRLSAEEQLLRRRVRLAERRDLAPLEEPPPGERVPQPVEARDLADRETDGATGGLDDEPATLIGAHVPTTVQHFERTNLGHSGFPPVGQSGIGYPIWRNARHVRSTERILHILVFLSSIRYNS